MKERKNKIYRHWKILWWNRCYHFYSLAKDLN